MTKQTHKGVPGRVRLAAGFAIAAIAGGWAMWFHPADLTGALAFPVFKTVLVHLGLLFIPFADAGDRRLGERGQPDRRARRACDHAGDDRGFGAGGDRLRGRAGRFLRPISTFTTCPIPASSLIFVAGLIGGGLGFLWYNAPPAAVFMGDTGSLALGGALGAIAVATKHEIVLAIVGGLFVVEALSVIIQVAYFKRTGRRVFLMAPIHHHFEKKGWQEPQIVIRFWIISLILAMIGLATLKIR